MSTRLIALTLLLVALGPQQSPTQSEQTATIRGLVLDAVTGKPIAGAVVQSTQVQQEQGQRAQSQTFKSTTGTDGVFVLDNLHPTSAFLSVEKGGYLKETRRYVLSPGLKSKESIIPYRLLALCQDAC